MLACLLLLSTLSINSSASYVLTTESNVRYVRLWHQSQRQSPRQSCTAAKWYVFLCVFNGPATVEKESARIWAVRSWAVSANKRLSGVEQLRSHFWGDLSTFSIAKWQRRSEEWRTTCVALGSDASRKGKGRSKM